MINLPNFSAAQEMFISGQDYVIDNGGKTVTLYYPPAFQDLSGQLPSGSLGSNLLDNYSTSFSFGNNFLAQSTGAIQEIRETGVIKLLCTYHPKNISEKNNIDPEIAVKIKKEGFYLYSKGYMTDYHKVMTCDFIVVNMPAYSVDPMKFRLISHPKDKNSIAQGRYFTCWWEQTS